MHKVPKNWSKVTSIVLQKRNCWYSACVFRDTPHATIRNFNQVLPQYCNHPSTTRTIHSRCSLYGFSEVRFRKGVARTNACLIPGTRLRSLLFWRGVQRVAVSCFQAVTEEDHFSNRATTIASMSLRNAGPLAPPVCCSAGASPIKAKPSCPGGAQCEVKGKPQQV